MTASESRCPSCGSPASGADVFCEACGHELTPRSSIEPGDGRGDPTEELARIDLPVPPGVDDQRTHLVVPGGSTVLEPCIACGQPIADDGFCTSCGAKARLPRDHWIESPSEWVGGVCDKGIVHARNEDAMALAATIEPVFAVLVVCDGVTTAPDSDRASLAAAKAACELLMAVPRSAGSFAARLSAWEPMFTAACTAANAEAVAVAHVLGDPDEPPSCTFVAAVRDVDLVAVAWCGDSRAYWLADDGEGSEQLTTDHSLGTEMIRAGRTRAEAEADPTCHTITRWLGADSIDPTCEFRAIRVERPGWLAVVSDGMWNEASAPADLAELIARAHADGAASPTALAESLAGFANERGGYDNITVALARCEPPLP